MTNEFIWPIPFISQSFHQFNGYIKGKYIWLPVLLDPTLKTLRIRCVFVKAGIQLLTSGISNVSHCSRILDRNQVMHLLFARRLLRSSKLPFIQDGNSIALSPCRSISFPLLPPPSIDHFPLLYLSPSFFSHYAPNIVQTGI